LDISREDLKIERRRSVLLVAHSSSLLPLRLLLSVSTSIKASALLLFCDLRTSDAERFGPLIEAVVSMLPGPKHKNILTSGILGLPFSLERQEKEMGHQEKLLELALPSVFDFHAYRF
jgi:hypothetical protein